MPAALIGQLLSACAGAYSAASSAAWWAASLPHTCRESLAHAALTCSGTTPRYFTPGFGPLALGWGWLLLGILHPLQAGDGHFAGLGRRPACRPRELGGPVARAFGPHTRPPQAGRDVILAGRRPPGSAGNIRGLGLHTCWRSGPLAGGRRFAGAFRHHRRGATHQSCSSKERATLDAVSFNPWIGVRVGEATQPGPAGQPPSSPRTRAIAALTDPERRPPAARTPIPPEVLAHDPLDPVQLSAWAVATALREARRGGAPGLSGMRAEHLKLLLQDVESQELLAYAATRVARAQLPPTVAAGVAMARLTALRKPDGGVRGIATGDAFRRLVARTLAKQWAPTIDQATRPFQFAMQSRAGTDALVLSVRAALDTRENAVIVSLDGRSACDSISRTSFLAKLREVAPQLLPFARLFMDKRLPIAGGMLPATCGRYAKVKAASRAILWPRRFLRWDNTSPLPAPQRPCTRQTVSWLSSTSCTSSRCQTVVGDLWTL